jgi:hypothetical protein
MLCGVRGFGQIKCSSVAASFPSAVRRTVFSPALYGSRLHCLAPTLRCKALLTFILESKIFQDSSSYQILRRMHKVLNIDENKK